MSSEILQFTALLHFARENQQQADDAKEEDEKAGANLPVKFEVANQCNDKPKHHRDTCYCKVDRLVAAGVILAEIMQWFDDCRLTAVNRIFGSLNLTSDVTHLFFVH
jgi:hypothetical protein